MIEDLEFLSAGAPMSKLGDTIAFAKAENNGTNMLLLDYGTTVGKMLEQTNVLDGVDRVLAFGSHIHSDHIGGAKQVVDCCAQSRAKLMFLMPDIKRQQKQLYTVLTALGIDRIDAVPKDEAADMLNLKAIDFEAIRHNDFDTEFKHFRVDTTALIMQTKTERKRNKIIFASDNNDKKFVRRALSDPELLRLYLELTFKGSGFGVHFSLKKLNKLAKELELGDKMKKRVTGMHMISESLSEKIKESGYTSALDNIYTGRSL